MTCFLSEIAIIAIELAIKNNEDRVLSLDECVNMIDNIGVSRSVISAANTANNNNHTQQNNTSNNANNTSTLSHVA